MEEPDVVAAEDLLEGMDSKPIIKPLTDKTLQDFGSLVNLGLCPVPSCGQGSRASEKG